MKVDSIFFVGYSGLTVGSAAVVLLSVLKYNFMVTCLCMRWAENDIRI